MMRKFIYWLLDVLIPDPKYIPGQDLDYPDEFGVVENTRKPQLEKPKEKPSMQGIENLVLAGK